MDYKKFLQVLWFIPKDNTNWVYYKVYHDLTTIEVDIIHQIFHFGWVIKVYDKDFQKITKPEDWVVLECVDRLLCKWYQAHDIVLEKVFPSGHGTSGRLDILVYKESKAYLMIECKTRGIEYDKACKKLQQNGGQLFTYFQQDRNTEYLILYASRLDGSVIEYSNEIIKIEESYQKTSNVEDLYLRWNKFTKQNGIFEKWVNPYYFESRALTYDQLNDIKESDASFIFNRFLEILRHNTVSDKPNAFNKMFTLFLCKIHDELTKNWSPVELEFQWLEWVDTHVSFQKRLSDLYRKGMYEFLSKQITDFSDEEFEKQFGTQIIDESLKKQLLEKFTKLRLQKSNEFAIKEVIDEESFLDNAVVLKEVVELLQHYKFRYAKKQPFLGDFFELLLTTWLKQEAWQFFTPVPIARFVSRSLPIWDIIKSKIVQGNISDILPKTIDYAAGSGHFIIEAMEEIQKTITQHDSSWYSTKIKELLKKYTDTPYDRALNYIYGIEKDYRLVRTSKVGCYLHGDGIATVIHGDGLDSFRYSKTYKGDLTIFDSSEPTKNKDNKQFDLVLSNPPYSVSSFKWNTDNITLKNSEIIDDFELYQYLTDTSSEIECLFIERTKQLLKEWGIATLILPSSILTNSGIYARARQILFSYFEIIAIVELWSNTFMATGTNTVTLFMRRRSDYDVINLSASVARAITNHQDVTIAWIEKPISKYVSHVWEWVSIDDYMTLVSSQPNEAISTHEIYLSYVKKLKSKSDHNLIAQIIQIEQEKILSYIMMYGQRFVHVKSGEKNIEKRFLWYEFSFRKGSEGIHAIQRSKSIDECTKLFDPDSHDNPDKVNHYIYHAFQWQTDLVISDELTDHVSYTDLMDVIVRDRAEFDLVVSLSSKKKVKIETKRNLETLDTILSVLESWNRPKWWVKWIGEWVSSLGWEHINLGGSILFENIKFVPQEYYDNANSGKIQDGDVLICKDGALTGKVWYFDANKYPHQNVMINEHVFLLRTESLITQKYLYNYLYSSKWQELLKNSITWQAQWWLNRSNLLAIKIPLPPLDIQTKIIEEINQLEIQDDEMRKKMKELKKEIDYIFSTTKWEKVKLWNIAKNLDYLRKPVTKGHREKWNIPYYWASGIVDFVSDYIIDDYVLLVAEDGANLKSRTMPIAFTSNGKARINNHAHILKFSEKVTHKLIELYLNKISISQYVTWQTQPKLNQENLNSIIIPLPPLAEQERIVGEIEKIEDQMAQLQSSLDQIPWHKLAILTKYLQ